MIDDIVLKPAQWQYDDYQKAKDKLYSQMLEVIGEEMPKRIPHEHDIGQIGTNERYGYNYCIREQRQRLNKLFGKEK